MKYFQKDEQASGTSSQKEGCGFPIAKIGVTFSLVTGAAVALCIDVPNTHDIKLARKMYSFLKSFTYLNLLKGFSKECI
ncbi:putative transposase, IS4 family [Nostoc carneum NIES-2107]|nr:putative transposase, IS4 family [Nostoc carneum NIES-2107]